MKKVDLSTKENKELAQMLGKEKAEQRALTFKVGEGQLKDVRALRKSKKAIARILTAMNSKKD